MDFTGRLAAFPASNLLQWADHERSTGTLVVRRSRREKRVALRRGRVVFCRSNFPQELFGQHLIAHGLLDAPAVIDALVRARAKKLPLGAALAESDRLPRGAVAEALDRSIRESVQDLLLWTRGVFYFEDGEPARQPLEVSLDPRELVLEGTRWIDELARIREYFPDDGVVLARGPFWNLDGLPPFERRIAGLVGGEITLGELYEKTGGVHFPFLEAVWRLYDRRVLAVARTGQAIEDRSRDLDLREVLLGLDGDDVLMGADKAILPLDAVEALVPVWVREPTEGELVGQSISLRAFLEGIDGRTTLRRLLSGDSETRADQIEMLLVELRRRNVVLLPASLDEVERRLGEESPLRRMMRRLRG